MAKKLTKNQQQYLKELNRLKRGLYRYKYLGIEPTQIITTQLPKRITKKTLKRIQQLKPLDIIKTYDFIVPDTGEVLNYKQYREYVKEYEVRIPRTPTKPIFEAPSFSNIVISNFRAQIADYPAMAQPILNDWLNQMISNYGTDAVAEMLQKGAEDGNIVSYKIAYDKEMLTNFISNMLDYLPEMGELTKESFLEAFEADEDWEAPI